MNFDVIIHIGCWRLSDIVKEPSQHSCEVAPVKGLEPLFTDSESAVLPLDETGIVLWVVRDSNPR